MSDAFAGFALLAAEPLAEEESYVGLRALITEREYRQGVTLP